jgi:hypothetical protein
MTISFAGHQFPPAIILHAVLALCAFHAQLSRRRNLLAERGLDVSFGPLTFRFAPDLLPENWTVQN